MNRMKVSVITVAYNSAGTIRDTLQSVLHQTYADIEYIVVDGASKDNTLAIIKEYEPLFGGRMRYVSEPDQGIYDAMNKGIRMATGDVVGVLNSDDVFYDTQVVEHIAEAFEANGVDAIFGNLYYVRKNDVNAIVRVWKGSPYYPHAFQRGWHPAHPTFYVRRTCYARLGGFDVSFEVSADFELMLRFIEKARLSTFYLDRYLVKMRVGGESTGSIRKIIKGNINVLRAFKKNGIRVSWFYPVMRLFPKVVGICKSAFRFI